MSLPDPQRPDPDPPAPEGAAPEPQGRPDWLVGSDDFRAPVPRQTEGARETPPVAKPADAAAPRAHLSLVRPLPDSAPTAPAAPAAPIPAEPRRAWSAAASSIPRLRRDQPLAVAPAAPPDDTEDKPEGRDRAPMPELLDDAPAANPAPVLAPLHEAWWVVALDELRSNGRLQIAIVAALVVLAAFTFWPRHDAAVSISYLRRHAGEVDGRAVTVRGRVGDVFPMGAGYSFYLRQGHESIVVFTRTRQPVMNQTISVKGTISTGYLDGAPHQSLFESAH